MQGTGIFFDGMTSARHDVSVELDSATLRVLGPDGASLAEWPYDEIQQFATGDDVLRLGRRGQTVLARLEIRDAALAAAIDERSKTVDRAGGNDRRARAHVIGWSIAAAAALVVVAVFVVPAIAARLAPVIPAGIERRLGDAVDAQVRSMLDTKKLGPRLVCGEGESGQAGQAALAALVAKLAAGAALPTPIRVSAIHRAEANAITLPGGHIYVYEGLLAKAESPDELAGVIAHEMGHVAHRDGTRSMLQGAGLSLLFGLLLGDFVGGGAVVIAAKSLIQSSYSREVEMAADAYGVRLVNKVGGNPLALGTFLTRIDTRGSHGARLWLDHPQAEDRLAAINAIAAAPAAHGSQALLTSAQWSALKRICAGG